MSAEQAGIEWFNGTGVPAEVRPILNPLYMSALSRKILQLMTYESQLKTLKIGVATQQVALVDTPEMYIQNPVLEERLKEYELISAKYNDLYEDILPDMNKMSEEYLEAKRKRRLDIFLSR
jgi:hypothetical protein